MADDKIIIEFDGDIKALKAKLSSSTKQVTKLNKAASKISGIIPAAAKVSAVALGGLTAALLGAVNEAKKFETITTQFEVLTGSVKQADKTVRELQEFAASTPFQFEGIAEAGKQLLGFGFEADDIVPKLKSIGDVSSAIGKPIQEISLIFGQVSAAGKLTGERLLQFQERAIPIGPAIAKTLGVAEESVKDLVSKGKVDFATFEKAFASLSEKGGFAFGGMIKQSKTLGGLLSTVSDNMSLLAADLGKELLPAAKGIAGAFLEVLKSLRTTDNFIKTAVVFWGDVIAESFSTSAAKTKESLDEATKGLAILDKQIEAIEKRAIEDRGKVSDGILNRFFDKKKATARLAQMGALLSKRSELLREQSNLEKTLKSQEEEEENERTALALEKEKEKAALILQAKREAMTEEELALDEARLEREQREIESVTMHEDAIAKIQKDRLKNIDEAKRQNARDNLKAEAKEQNLRMKLAIVGSKENIALSQATATANVNIASSAAGLISAVSASGSKLAFFAQKAAGIAGAIVATQLGMARALAVDPTGILSTRVGIAGGINVATIAATAVKGFANGGLVEGGVLGRDSVPAMMQSGEIVAPRKSFEEVIGSVRAKREAEKQGTTTDSGTMEVVVGFADNAFEIIEEKILERRTLGIGAI